MTPKAANHQAIALLLAGLMGAGCAGAPRAQPGTSSRVKDTVPEKIAAQRAAANLQLEQEDERWGIEAARDRKRAPDRGKTTAPPVNLIPMGSVNVREGAQTPSTK